MATREVGIASNGDTIAREQGIGTLSRIVRSDTKDIRSVSDYVPFDFELASAAAAIQLITGPVATASFLDVALTGASTDTPVDGTLTITTSGGAVQVLSGCRFLVKQGTGSITSATIAQSSGSLARVRAIVGGF